MSPILRQLVEQRGLPMVDADRLDHFLDEAAAAKTHSILFFAGEAGQRAETTDVAVILPELLLYFAGRLRGALIAPAAEAELRPRLHAYASPCLVVMRRRETVGVLPKIYDWADYIARIEAFLEPSAAIVAGPQRPKVEFTHGRGA